MAKILLEIEIEPHDCDPEEIRARAKAAIADLMKSGVVGPDWKLRDQDDSLLAHIARLDTFEEKSIRDAITEHGLRDVGEIAEHVHADQADMDWLVSQDEALQGFICQARGHLGWVQQDTIEDTIAAHPAFIAATASDPTP